MSRSLVYLTATALFSISASTLAQVAGSDEPLHQIAFGSCAKERFSQPIWEAIGACRPDLFLFLGDNIYGDTDDMKVLREKYEVLGAKEGFAAIREMCPVLATWDDHDYGRNDAGAEYEHKEASQQILMDFFGEPEDSPRRKQEGVYGSWSFGSEGAIVQVLLLDTRYHRTEIRKAPTEERPKNSNYFGPYQTSTEDGATILGETQWAWLEEELKKSADLRIIGTSIQLIPNGHWWEKWGLFPNERDRFFQLVRDTRANGVILVSGDRHLSEVNRVPAHAIPDGVGYPLHEVTSSGLTQAGGGSRSEPSAQRLHPIFKSRNFGLLSIDWEKREVTMEIRNEEGEPMNSTTVDIDSLHPPVLDEEADKKK